MPAKVSWGILGVADIARHQVIPAMLKGELTSVDAIASRNLAKAQEAASALGIPKAYGSYEELLADPGIEAIYNPLLNSLHVPWTIRALEAGKHVLCEKPIALTADEARSLVAAEARSGRKVREAFMFHHHPQWLRAREICRAGTIGEVRSVQMVFSYYNADPANIRNRADIGGGGLYDIGCYGIASSRFIFEAEPLRVIGMFDFDPITKVDRLGSGMAEYPGGRSLSFTYGTQLVPFQRVEIFGSKGRVEVQVPFNQDPTLPARLRIDDGRDHVGGGITEESFAPMDQYGAQADAFSRGVRGLAPFPSSIEDAIMNMRIIDALFRSVRDKSWQVP